MIMRTRVRMPDGNEDTQFWPVSRYPSPAAVLTQAVADAEEDHGQPHDGAWLEFIGQEDSP